MLLVKKMRVVRAVTIAVLTTDTLTTAPDDDQRSTQSGSLSSDELQSSCQARVLRRRLFSNHPI